MALILPEAAWLRRPTDLHVVPRLRRVLLGNPELFALEQELNPHMVDSEGCLHSLDHDLAMVQWQALRDAYLSLGIKVEVLPPIPGAVDSCFTANPSLVLPLPDHTCEVWLSRMAYASRQPEVSAHREFFTGQGLPCREIDASVLRFEGCGDGLLHPGRFLIHAGVGSRSDISAWRYLCSIHPELEVLVYQLVDPRYYHLDTALAILDPDRALFVPDAFTAQGIARLGEAFADLIEVPPAEAARFAANAHCPDGVHVLIEQGCPTTRAALQDRGFHPVEVATSEFRKSGGSVFCLKQAW